MSADDEELDIVLRGIHRDPPTDGYEPVTVDTNRGAVRLRYYRAAAAQRGVLFIGSGGGWSSPGRGELFPRLCAAMTGAGLAALRLRPRRPDDLAESVLDALVGLHFLQREGVRRFGLVGHGFGAGVAAQAAANAEGTRALVALAARPDGLEAVAALPAGCAGLFVHGADDAVSPPSCTRRAYAAAPEPKYLRVVSGAGHGFDEVVEPLLRELQDWLVLELTEGDPRLRRPPA